MGLTIGLVGLNVALDEPTAGTDSGAQVTLTGVLTGDTIAEVVSQMALLRGYLPVAGERPRTVPVTLSEFPTWDGYYTLDAATVTADADAVTTLRLPFTATLTPRRRKTLPPIESQLSAGLRENDHSIVAANVDAWFALPYGPLLPTSSHTFSTAFRSTAAGSIAVLTFPSVTPPVTIDSSYRCPPGTYLDASARFQSPAGTDAAGVQVAVADAGDWALTNDLLRITPSDVANEQAILVEAWGGSAWSTPIEVRVGADVASTFTPLVSIEGVEVVAESPEMVAVRVIYLTGFTLTLTLRRGSFYVEGSLTGPSALDLGLKSTQTGAWVDDTSGAHKDTNDADSNRLVVFTPHANDVNTADREIVLTTAGTRFDFGLGIERGGTGSSTPDTLAALRAQYFARQSETVVVL